MKVFKYISLVAIIAFAGMAFTSAPADTAVHEVQWMSWEEAAKLNETNPKKIFVDVYTSWCGWCKVMDKKTFTDEKVANYLTENFYAVKLDAESREAINFKGTKFEFVEVEGSRRGGIHMLAYELLGGKLSYPTVVTLNENFERIAISPGFKEAPMMYNELKFAAEEHYKTSNFEEFMATQGGK